MKALNRFRERVDVLLETVPTLDERKKIIEDLNEECYQTLGKFLAPDILERLGDWLLHEIHADKSTNKVKKSEYPILSKYQLKRRSRKNVLMADENSLSVLSHHLKNHSTLRNKNRVELWGEINE